MLARRRHLRLLVPSKRVVAFNARSCYKLRRNFSLHSSHSFKDECLSNATEKYSLSMGNASVSSRAKIGAPASSSNASEYASSAQGNKEVYSGSALARCGVFRLFLSP